MSVFFEASEEFLFVLDKHGIFQSVNEFGAAILDYELEEIIGKHFLDFVAVKNKNAAAKSFQSILASDSLVEFGVLLLGKFGDEMLIDINAKVLSNGKSIAGVIGIGRNITKLRNCESEIEELSTKLTEANRIASIERQRSVRQKSYLEELNRMKSEFVSNISHELRTPLASIIGFSETIASDPNMPEEMKEEFNRIILNEGKRLAKLVNDVLEVSRIEGGAIEISKNEFDLKKLIESVIDNQAKEIESKKIKLSVDIPHEPVMIIGDKERLTQVFNGLLNNAVKFTDPGGRITVSFQVLYKEVEIVIIDTGIGIPEKDLPFIFQKFYRVDRPGAEIPGTGLGLVFVKQILDLHRAFISVQSEVNKGTTVIVKLPKEIKLK
jgi:PAS domain S-box-containing protein